MTSLAEDEARTAQERIVDHPGGPARIVAGPGTGKSHTIARRIARLLDRGVRAETILALTFTRASAADLRETLAGTGLPSGAAIARTIHSFALREVRRHTGESVVGPYLLDDWEEDELLRHDLGYRVGMTPGKVSERLKEYDAAWGTLGSPPSFPEQAKFEGSIELLRAVLRFSRRGEVVYKLKELLEAQPDLDLSLSYLVVDEFQDLNRCDQEAIRLLTRHGAELLVAGDDDQSIYAFRHADSSGIRNFENVYPGAITYPLDGCWRCSPEILARANRLIAHEADRIPKSLASLRPSGGTIEARQFSSANAQYAAIVEWVGEELDSGTKPAEILILAPRKDVLPDLAQRFGAAGRAAVDLANVPDSAQEIPVRRLRYAALLAQDSEHAVALRGWFRCYPGVGVKRMGQLLDAAYSMKKPFPKIVRMSGDQAILDGLRELDRMVNLLRAADEAESAIRSAGAAAGLDAHETDLLGDFVAGLPLGCTSEEAVAALGQFDWRETREDPNAVRLMSLHGAKGLSADVVFIPDANDELIPGTNDEDEQRRLFYVSLTRARRRCVVSFLTFRRDQIAYRGRGAQLSGAARQPTRFLKQAAIATVSARR